MGMLFKSADLETYFSAQDWYKPQFNPADDQLDGSRAAEYKTDRELFRAESKKRPAMKNIPKLLFLAFLLPACSKHVPYQFVITALKPYNENNSGRNAVDDSTGNIPAKAYAIRLEYTNQITGSTDKQDDESIFAPVNPVQSFAVYSLTDFDPSHPAGSLLNDYFLYSDYSSQVSSADTIPALLAGGGMGTGYGSIDGANPPKTWTVNNYLVLMQPPAYLGTRSFVIRVGFAGNSSLTDTITANLQP